MHIWCQISCWHTLLDGTTQQCAPASQMGLAVKLMWHILPNNLLISEQVAQLRVAFCHHQPAPAGRLQQ